MNGNVFEYREVGRPVALKKCIQSLRDRWAPVDLGDSDEAPRDLRALPNDNPLDVRLIFLALQVLPALQSMLVRSGAKLTLLNR